MLVNRKTIFKLNRLLDIYNELVFEPLEDLDLKSHTTFEHYRLCPDEALQWTPIERGTCWGKAWQTMWLKGSFTVPESLNNQKLYIQARSGAVEVLLLVDGVHKGIFNRDSEEGVKGYHHTRLALSDCHGGSVHKIALECYAGHPIVGVMPFDPREKSFGDSDQFNHIYDYVRICRKRQYIMDFVTRLRILLQIAEASGSDSFRGASIFGALEEVFAIIPQQPSDYNEKELHLLIHKALVLMKSQLQLRASGSAPVAAIIGHSHMDTAWLWTVDETRRKCARTFSNSLNLMDEFGDYMFLQSSPYHLEMMRKDYPGIFERIAKRIKEGRWEPNGGSWVEPDCNIPSGESLTRHFLYGQKYLKEHFDYRADSFWQPDVFGYSASIPQILKQSGISYFLTTKLSWNEETRFPYDSFYWEGIDGSSVLTHFNTTHCWPDPKSLISQTDDIQHKDIQRDRYCAFGYGDGGGGPMFEMIETAPYLKDLDGVPRTEYSTVSDFMARIAEEDRGFPTWKGELYLELHRGTLTSFHKIKELNRRVENLLREAEFLYSLFSMNNSQIEYPAQLIEEQWKILLQNQFHDILPGTSIPEVNVRAAEEMETCRKGITLLIDKLNAVERGPVFHLWNSLNWQREKNLIIRGLPENMIPLDKSIQWQKVTTVTGEPILILSGLKVPGLGSAELTLTNEQMEIKEAEPFYTFNEGTLETPHYILCFGPNGAVISLLEKSSGRELVKRNGSLNNLLIGEDIPARWDNWDIDMDQKMKMNPLCAESEWVISDKGPLQVRLKNRYEAGLNSVIEQHMVLYRDSLQIDFETLVDWKEDHKLLKTEFDLNIQTDRVRNEIQYGHLERDTHSNLPQDRARFEVCNHQWSDLSEPNFGAALLNDCKYGISCDGSNMRLSLLKSGTHPDSSADRGVHSFTYSLFPHNGGFSTEHVIRPARELNTPISALVASEGSEATPSFFTIDKSNIMVETIKRTEDGTGYIIRFFESEKCWTHCSIRFNRKICSVEACNMLEECSGTLILENDNSIRLDFHGFEIKTLKIIVDD